MVSIVSKSGTSTAPQASAGRPAQNTGGKSVLARPATIPQIARGITAGRAEAVSRAAVVEVEGRHADLTCFPLFGIIRSPASFGQHLSSDFREVTERGVSDLMECFLSSFLNRRPSPLNHPISGAQVALPSPSAQPVQLVRCDEHMNERGKLAST
jgi:hypothetical protein